MKNKILKILMLIIIHLIGLYLSFVLAIWGYVSMAREIPQNIFLESLYGVTWIVGIGCIIASVTNGWHFISKQVKNINPP